MPEPYSPSAVQAGLVAALVVLVIVVIYLHMRDTHEAAHCRRCRHSPCRCDRQNFVPGLESDDYRQFLERQHAAIEGMSRNYTPRSERDTGAVPATPDRVAEAALLMRLSGQQSTEAETSGFDYGAYTHNQVITPRMAENHARWYNDTKKFSMTAHKPMDDLDMETTLSFRGLQRPRAVVTDPRFPIQTEIDMYDLAPNRQVFAKKTV